MDAIHLDIANKTIANKTRENNINGFDKISLKLLTVNTLDWARFLTSVTSLPR